MSARRRRFSDAEDALIVAFARDGRSATEAARRLGPPRTRCGVIARAIRLGEPFRCDPGRALAISAAGLARYWATNPVRGRATA